MRHIRASLRAYLRPSCAAAVGLLLAFCASDAPRAQRAKEPEVKVTGVASHTSDEGAVVTITGDGNLRRAQTWQDGDGTFHVILPKGATALRNSASARGVKMQRVGDSLEIVVQARPGANVTVQPRFNRLDLVVEGGLEDRPVAAQSARKVSAEAAEQFASESPFDAGNEAAARQSRARRAPAANNAAESAPQAETRPPAAAQQNAAASGSLLAAASGGDAGSPVAAPSDGRAVPESPAAEGGQVQTAPPQQQQAAPPVRVASVNQQNDSMFLTSGVLGTLGLAGLCVGLFVYRKRRAAEGAESKDAKQTEALVKVEKKETNLKWLKQEPEWMKRDAEAGQAFEQSNGDRRRGGDRRMIGRGSSDRRKSGLGAEPASTLNQPLDDVLDVLGEKSAGSRGARHASGPAMPAVVFGAYRIDQEVSKLAAGEAHSIDVLASRATDDRRAVETSLIKVLRSPESDEESRGRARRALEEYGFVARQSAALLLAQEAYERASAARVLGEIRSRASLPFLLEALYDAEPVVRQEVVSSLGELRLPKAIGPLIDVARRYPEMPAEVLRPALNSCSVETLESEFGVVIEHRSSYSFGLGDFSGEITGLEPPQPVEVLPEWLEDDSLADSLERLNSVDVEARTLAAQSLAQFQVQRAVDALAAMAACDREAVVRASAVTSLGVINHESVFAPILMSLADDAREVRAAAARALSRLSFDRADAYVRVIEAADEDTLRNVTRACVKAGLSAQAFDRMTSDDRRQAYESFALLAMIVKAGEVSIVFDAIANHKDADVRLAALKLLCMMARPGELVEPLRRLAARERMPEKVRVALLEAASRVEQGEALSAPPPSPADDALASNQW